MLFIDNITVCADQKIILQNLSFNIDPGTMHVIMGQNGSGKSSFANMLMGYSQYELTSGHILYQQQDLMQISIQNRSKMGIFLAFQQPLTVPGVTVFQFLKEIYRAADKPQLQAMEFQIYLESLLQQVALDNSFLYRGLHENFSGGGCG